MRQFLRSKIERLRITSINPEGVGGIVLDGFLMEKAGILPGERVLVGNISNGQHWETHVTQGEKFMVSVRESGAKLCKIGDILAISTFELSDLPIKPKIVVVDKENKFEKIV